MVQTAFIWPAIGNNLAVDFLSQSLKNQRIAQTYIFIGPDDLGKSTIALAFAKNLQGGPVGFNSDLHILQAAADKKSITIEQVREFIKDLSLSTFLNSYKIGLIKGADNLTTEAQHALLKTLEEPQDKVVIILLLQEESHLLPTILSRGQLLYFYPVATDIIYDYLVKEHQASRSLAKNLASLSLGRPLKARHFIENPELYEEYLAQARLCLTGLGPDLNDRLATLDQLFIDKSYSASASRQAQAVLDIFEGLSRDFLLMAHDQATRCQHFALATELQAAYQILVDQYGSELGLIIIQRLQNINQARQQLVANVNPRLVLEQVLINF